KMFVRWLTNALRRGAYVLAIDSVEAFACQHPAFANLSDLTGAGAAAELHKKTGAALKSERRLLNKILMELARRRSTFGESLIVVANSQGRDEFSELNRSLKRRYPLNYPPKPPGKPPNTADKRLAMARRPFPITALHR